MANDRLFSHLGQNLVTYASDLIALKRVDNKTTEIICIGQKTDIHLSISRSWSWDLPSSVRETLRGLSLAALCSWLAICPLRVCICSWRSVFCLCRSSQRDSILHCSSWCGEK